MLAAQACEPRCGSQHSCEKWAQKHECWWRQKQEDSRSSRASLVEKVSSEFCERLKNQVQIEEDTLCLPLALIHINIGKHNPSHTHGHVCTHHIYIKHQKPHIERNIKLVKKATESTDFERLLSSINCFQQRAFSNKLTQVIPRDLRLFVFLPLP